MALESWEGTRASRHVEEGLSSSFSGGGGKPSFPSTSAGDLRELPRVPLRGEGSCGVWREDSVLLSMPGRKQVPHLVMTGRIVGFLELRCLNGVSEEVRRGAQGASLMAPGKSGLLARGEGVRVIL